MQCPLTYATATYKADTRPVDEEEDVQVPGLQLLNSVSSGGTLSSLFTILRLFTEDVKLRYEEEGDTTDDSDRAQSRRNSVVSEFSLDAPITEKQVRHSNSSSSLNTVTGNEHERDTSLPSQSPKSRNSSLKSTPSKFKPTKHVHGRSTTSLGTANSYNRPYETIIARAQVDTTLAVIPAEAFRRLTVKFPNAAAHIVQVILTRLSRVTLLTSHQYLGLTKEIVRTEKAINELACYPLPDAFYALGGMQRLRRRFVPETSLADDPDDINDYFSMNPPSPMYGPAMGQSHKRPSEDPGGVRMRYNPVTPGLPVNRSPGRTSSLLNMTKLTTSPDKIGPIQLPHPQGMFNLKDSAPNTPYASRIPNLPADFDLRAVVMECISKAMGLVPATVSTPNSIENSPQVYPVDRDAKSSAFRTSYASLSMLGSHSRDDESSIITSSSSRATQSQPEMENEVQILYFAKGSTLVAEGQNRAGVFYVIDGHLDVSMSKSKKGDATAATSKTSGEGDVDRKEEFSAPNRTDAQKFRFAKNVPTDFRNTDRQNKGKRQLLFTVKPGGISGYLSALTGYASYVDIVAKTDVYVGFLPAHALERMTDSQPIVLLTLAKRLISLLSPLSESSLVHFALIHTCLPLNEIVLHIDLALDWMQVNAGQVIYREGESSDSFYICIQGRLRAISEQASGAVKVKNEYGQGESVGELDCLTSSPRPSTLHAIRDTELVRMPAQLFNAIAIRHPSITVQMTRILASRVRFEVQTKSRVANSAVSSETQQNYNLKVRRSSYDHARRLTTLANL